MEEERAKGKPKTKTKSAAVSTQVHLSEPNRRFWWPKSYSGRKAASIRVSKAEDGDSSDRHKKIIGSATTNTTASGPPLISIQLSATMGGKAQAQTAAEEPRSAADDGSAYGEIDPPATMATGNVSVAEQQALAAANVDDVRRNFIALIRYNKLQYFYLGTLMYSVMNICFIYYKMPSMIGESIVEQGSSDSQIKTPPNPLCSDSVSTNLDSAKSRVLAGEIHGFLRIALPCSICILALIAIMRSLMFDKLPLETRPANTAVSPREGAQKALRASLKRMLVVLIQSSGLLVAMFLLCSPIMLLDSIDANTVISFSNNQRDRENLTSNLGDIKCRKGDANWIPEAFAGQPSATTMLALIYLQPLLLEGSSIIVKLIGAFAILPALVLVPLRYLWLLKQQQRFIVATGALEESNTKLIVVANQTGQSRHFTSNDILSDPQQSLAANLDLSLVVLGCLPLMFLLGILVKRRHLAHAIAQDTFSGASRLIEAKVSLEHQRQQQETLLLSVLPAYVAEQVKRNMLKKMTTTTIYSNSNMDALEHGPSQALNSLQPAQQMPAAGSVHGHSLASRSFIMHTGGIPGGQQQQLETVEETVNLTANSNELKPASLDQPSSSNLAPEGQQRFVGRSTSVASASSLRNSFLLSTRFTTSLVSGASFISGTLGPGANRGFHQQSSMRSTHKCHYPTAGIHQHSSSVLSNHQTGANTSTARRGFNELYIRTYNNVSLLYGDIVGFTRLCTQLSSSQLVRVLNDLFSHFDHLAEKHKIMRIKILGDCYYGVSGIPEFAVMGAKSRASRNDNHAINCVNMGLDMIHYIRCLNVERASNGSSTLQKATLPHSVSASEGQIAPAGEGLSFVGVNTGAGKAHVAGFKSAGNCTPMPAFELNMRIGVHTGHIHSGVIGLKKWQFDVWSNDVSIAMHCESSGAPGRVQVTKATVEQLNGAFSFEKVPDKTQDSFLVENGIETYLICDRTQQPEKLQSTLKVDQTQPANVAPINNKKQQQVALKRKKQSVVQSVLEAANMDRIDKEAFLRGSADKKQQLAIDSNMDEDNIRAATIGTIRQTLLAGESANTSSALGLYGLIFNHHDMTPFMLNYRDPAMNKLYANRHVKSWPLELLTLVLLLGALFPLVIWQLLVKYDDDPPINHFNNNAQIKFLILIVLISTVLMIANLWPCFCTNHRRQDRDAYNQIIDSNEKIKAHQVIDTDKSGCARRQSSRLGKSVVDTYWNLRKLFRPAANRLQSIDSVRRLRPKTGIAIVLFFTVILLQAYLNIYGRYLDDRSPCSRRSSGFIGSPGSAQKGDKHWFIESRSLGEQYQLTVILLLISLDSSANILSYRTKSIIIASIVCLQILSAIAWNQADVPTPPVDCKFSEGDDGGGGNQAEGDRMTHQSQMVDHYDANSANQKVLYWTSEALLLILTLWSWAFARQHEYTSRTNFLWRMRLNVDHEELEYISGINKVLLENILPSHVVQHYLTHPNGQTSLSNQLPTLQSYMRMSMCHCNLLASTLSQICTSNHEESILPRYDNQVLAICGT